MVEFRKNQHYLQKIDEFSEEKLKKVLAFLEKEGLSFYDLEGPLVKQRSQGSQLYVDVTISIKLS